MGVNLASKQQKIRWIRTSSCKSVGFQGRCLWKAFSSLITLYNRPTLERVHSKGCSADGCGFKNKPRNGRTCNCAGELRLFDMAKSQYHLLWWWSYWALLVNLQSSCQTVPLVAWFMTGVTFYWHPVLLPAMVRIRFASARERNKKLVDWNEMNPQETKDPTHRCKLTRSKLEKYLDVFGFLSFKGVYFGVQHKWSQVYDWGCEDQEIQRLSCNQSKLPDRNLSLNRLRASKFGPARVTWIPRHS